jgi:hypothetical protein
LATAAAAADPASKVRFDATNLYVQRISNSNATKLSTGVDGKDIFYPASFGGRWNASSRLVRFEAPLGEDALGGARVRAAAEDELAGGPLDYVVKFSVVNNGSAAISDRLYNLESIAIASMGAGAVVDDFQMDSDLANHVRLALSPYASGGALFDIDLYVTQRASESQPPDSFSCLESVRQVITSRTDANAVPRPPREKIVETVTAYRQLSPSRIVARQRTASYLAPRDPRYRLMAAGEPRVQSTAVDLREYLIVYTKI